MRKEKKKKDIGVAFSDLSDLLRVLIMWKYLPLQMWRADGLPKNKSCAVQKT